MGSDDIFKKKRAATQAKLKRQQAPKHSGKLIAIVCEGDTEVNYLNDYFVKHRLSNVKCMRANGYTDPEGIVNFALQFGEANPEYEEIFCVFDHDDREHECQNAIKKIKDQQIKKRMQMFSIILSTPCLELWFLLHFEYSSRPHPQSREGVQIKSNIEKLLRKHWPEYHKAIKNFEQLEDKLASAIHHAQKLERENRETHSKNPATNFHTLFNILVQHKKRI